MKILVVGSGGREHAICWKIAQSKKVEKIYCAPGNAGIAEYAECVNIGAMELEKLADFAEEKQIELTALEYRLLLIFAQNQTKLLTRTQILEKIWDMDGNFVEDNTLTVYIKRLREKLGDAIHIETVRGMGYRVD